MDLRQIDVLVAEKVLQWKRGRAEYGEMSWKTPDGKGYLFVPRFSSDITAAWQVVEKMRRSGWDHFSLVQGHEGAWDCMFMQWSGPDDKVYQEIADTAPLAICITALRAVGVEVPQDA